MRVSGQAAVVENLAVAMLGKLPQPRYAHFSDFLDADGETIDQGIALYFPAPHSFTGEHVLELQGHGGPVVMDMLLRRCLELGVRIARPGEFSERAYLNDKMDLSQAEAVADLIDSETEAAARLATRSLQGVFSRHIHALVDELIQLRVYVEASMDFPEEEIDFLSEGKVSAHLQSIIESIEDIVKNATSGRILRDGISLVIAGEPNAGKSSLLNALSGTDTAIVTDVAGTTRDVLRERIQIGGVPVHLVDTAGLRKTRDRIEAEGVRRAQIELQRADHLLWVYDAVCDPQNRGLQRADLPERVPLTLIRNKVDQLPEAERPPKQTDIPEIAVSAHSGEGLQQLKQHLLHSLGFQGTQNTEFLARRRHLVALQKAHSLLLRGQAALLKDHAGELLAQDLNLAQQQLAAITGAYSADDLLGDIFSSFCIGK